LKLAAVGGRSAIVFGERLLDLELTTGGVLPADPMLAFPLVVELGRDGIVDLVADDPNAPRTDEVRLGAPVPRPQKIFGVGLNYRSHAAEAGLEVPDEPLIFTKLPSAIIGPEDDVLLPGGPAEVDWEAELVVVIGRRARRIRPADAWSYVLGFMCGQDISDRAAQHKGRGQLTIAKSYDTFAPIGPVVVTLDEVSNRDDVAVRCRLNDSEVQAGRTADLVFSISDLVSRLSAHHTLEPGDLLFTGTPSGVGLTRRPPRFLTDGDILETEVEGIGTMRNRCVLDSPGLDPVPATGACDAT
jgi:2,4-didehydro-3-deoxy-L-rhamnonate hydrolase